MANDVHDEGQGILARSGFVPVDYDPFTRTITTRTGLQMKRGNTIFVRDPAEASARVRAAPRYDVKGVAL